MTSEAARDRQVAIEALAATSTKDLLRQAYVLTHRIHNITVRLDGGGPTAAQRRPLREQQADLRAARDLIDVEIIRRTGV